MKMKYEFLDTWPSGTFNLPEMLAYKELEYDGILEIVKVMYSKKRDRFTVRYYSCIPRKQVYPLLTLAKGGLAL